MRADSRPRRRGACRETADARDGERVLLKAVDPCRDQQLPRQVGTEAGSSDSAPKPAPSSTSAYREVACD